MLSKNKLLINTFATLPLTISVHLTSWAAAYLITSLAYSNIHNNKENHDSETLQMEIVSMQYTQLLSDRFLLLK